MTFQLSNVHLFEWRSGCSSVHHPLSITTYHDWPQAAREGSDLDLSLSLDRVAVAVVIYRLSCLWDVQRLCRPCPLYGVAVSLCYRFILVQSHRSIGSEDEDAHLTHEPRLSFFSLLLFFLSLPLGRAGLTLSLLLKNPSENQVNSAQSYSIHHLLLHTPYGSISTTANPPPTAYP